MGSITCIARIEYLKGNYEASANILASALENVQDFDYILVRVVKDYIRSLMKLHMHDTAIKVAEEYEYATKQYPEFWNRIQIMYSVLKEDPKYADQIIKDLHTSVEARTLACRCLFEFYAKRGDSESALRYYELERKHSFDNSEFIDREGF